TRLAHALRELGVGAGDRVAFLGPNEPALAETLFACGLLGAVFVPLNTRLAVPELAYNLDDSGAETLIWSSQFAETVAALRETVKLRDWLAVGEEYERLLTAGETGLIDEPVGLDDTCMIQYTSGTSGRPKGVMLSHGNITWNCYNILLDVDVTGDEVSLVSAPMFHTAALNQLFLPTVLKGGTSVLMAAFDPGRAFDLIAKHRVTWMFGVPTMFHAMAQSPRWPDADLSSVRILMCGGAPVPEALIRTYQERGLLFLQGYGLTETAPGALFLRAGDSVRKAGSAGTPCFFTDVRIVGPDGAAVGPGEVGEVVIQGPNVSTGYWQRPEATEAAYTADGWFRSGDAAVVDAEGYVTIVDRVKDMFISGGENIYPAEVEQVIYAHPDVADCAVIGVPDEHWGEVGRAVVVLRPGARATGAEVLAFLAGRLAKYKIPKSVVVVDALPRNATGKLLRARLRESYGITQGEDQ
ncbi:MAG TPA: long-chain fatty acid--CoA ligase, partial [Jatrophihabitans sp.]|nr:long-chain fatty acid--CoA ligase [Jatrophihabitans sp.]